MKKAIVTYFSCSGATWKLAHTLADAIGADIFEITPKEPYTAADLNWNDRNSRSSREMKDKTSRPEIENSVDVSEYDTVFVGYPIWWGVAPTIVNTFLESCNLSGKTVVPFCTSGGSGIGTSVEEIRTACPDAEVLDGFRGTASSGEEQVSEWVASAE